MKVVKAGLVAAALLGTIITQAQTAEQIVAKHIDAIGGKDKLSQIKTVYMENSVQMMGSESPNTITIVNGKGYKSETEFNGSKFIQCFTDKGGWMINPMAGGSAEPIPDEQYKGLKDQLDVGGPLLNYDAKGNKVELAGNDSSGYKIKLTTKDGQETMFYVDSKTYYITKITKKGNMMGQEVDLTINLSDYRKTDFGYVLPYAVDTDFGGNLQMTANVKKVEINKPVDDKIFEIPAK